MQKDESQIPINIQINVFIFTFPPCSFTLSTNFMYFLLIAKSADLKSLSVTNLRLLRNEIIIQDNKFRIIFT